MASLDIRRGLPGIALAALGLIVAGPLAAGAGAAFGTGAATTLFNAGFAIAAAGIVTAGFGVISGALMKGEESPSSSSRESPTYGFSQWQMRVKGDAVLPVVYTGNKHKIAPIVIQIYTTPQGEQDDDFAKVLKARGQGISGLLAICEGPIVSIEDVRFNDEPVFEEVKGRNVGTGNGSKKVFRFPAKRGVLKTLKVYVAGTSKGWNLTERTWSFRATPGNSVYRAKLALTDPIADERDISVKVNLAAIDLDDIHAPRPHIWAASENELRVNMQQPYANAPRIDVTYYVRTMDGLTVRHDKNADEFVLEFATAPAASAAITVDYLRKTFSGLSIDWRNGAAHQLHLPAFESIRNTYARGVEVTSSEQTFNTENEVDNVILSFASGSGGFTSYDDEGNRDPVEATFTIEVKRQASLSGNAFNTWQLIPDPAGKRGPKRATEFSVRGDSISQLFWSFSIRGLLEKNLAANPKNATAQQLVRDFVRAKYSVRLKRTNTVKGNANSLFIDALYIATYDEVIDEWLSYPGVAMLGFHAVASEKLQGSAPNVTCVVKGTRSVESYNGSAWSEDPDNQGNRVWAAIDLLTHKRYGSGDFYTKAANIDTASAITAANWLDETVPLESGATEVRSRLDLVLDTRKSPIAWAMDILRPGRVIPVLQGNKWRFVIDDSVDLTAVTTLWEDGTSCRIAKNSVRAAHESQAIVPNEIQSRFLDETEGWEAREVWISPDAPTAERRVQRIELYGITRRSEATRTTRALYTQVVADKMTMEFVVSPKALGFEAGDVIRLRSTRLGIDEYLRIVRLEFGTSDFFVKVQGIPYIPAVYGQADARQATPQPATPHVAPPPVLIVPSTGNRTGTTGTSGETTSGRPIATRRSSRMQVRVRRVA